MQIVRDHLNNLILPIELDSKLSIEVRNRSHHYRGVVVTLGGYNLNQAGSIKASSTYDEALYEANPKQTILINKKYKNMLTKEGERELIITQNDLGSYLCIYYKSGDSIYYGEHDVADSPDMIKYAKNANHLLSVKLVAREQVPNNNYELMAA